MEGVRAALGHHLELSAHGPAVLGLVGVGQHLELGHGVDVGRRHVAAVVARVDVGDPVDRHVVGVRTLAVHGEATDRAELGAGAGVLRERARDQRREVEQHAAVVRNVGERRVLHRERALAAVRLQLDGARRDLDALREGTDLQHQHARRELVVGAHDQIGLLEGLETLERRREHVGVRPDDWENEAALPVRHGGEDFRLGFALERDADTWQQALLGVDDGPLHRRARGLRANYGRMGQEEKGNER